MKNGPESIPEMLAPAAAGALDDKEERRVEEHAATCAECAAEWGRWKRLGGALHRLRDGSVAGFFFLPRLRHVHSCHLLAVRQVAAEGMGELSLLRNANRRASKRRLKAIRG